ncbi:MAG TPA: hypothetical protein VD948_03005 [Rhodothermales bacterium]|nr:hypothetical protein [Rhodothermales bacterium]
MQLRHDKTGELAPAHYIGHDEDGRPLYQWVEGYTPTEPYELDEDGNFTPRAVRAPGKVVTYQSDRSTINICPACEQHLLATRSWPKDTAGREMVDVHFGLHRGTCDVRAEGCAAPEVRS